MKTNKNIDRLFQEKLKDFEVSPPAEVWEGIESNLHQKNPKRVLPLWLRMTGAAAILLLLTLGGINYFDKNSNDQIITDSSEIENVPVNKSDILNPAINNSTENNSVITEATQNNDAVSETLKVDNTQTDKQIKFNSSNENSQISELNDIKRNNFSNSQNDLEDVNTRSTSTQNSVANIYQTKSNNQKTNTNELLKLNTKEENSNSQIANQSNTFLNNKILNPNTQSSVANNTTDKKNLLNNSESTNSNTVLNDSKNSILNTDFEKNNNSNTQSIFNITDSSKDVIAQSKKEDFGEKLNIQSNLDSIQKDLLKSKEEIGLVSNNYDDILLTDPLEDDKKEEEDSKKWSIASTIAPIYYNTFNTKGSPLDLQFKDSPKTGSKSIAYGFKIGYKLNDKLTLQSGVSKIDVGYKIGNVYINPSRQLEGRLTNVNYTNTATILNVNAKNYLDDVLLETNSTSALKGELNQSFGYIEVPLELKYSLTNTSKKLGVNLIGGVSTLLLNKNEVFVTTSEFSSNLGEANNLNKVNFSGNIGFDIDYQINKKIYLNVAPMLKIHTKTFSSSDNNFEPYLFGVYTGINYKF